MRLLSILTVAAAVSFVGCERKTIVIEVPTTPVPEHPESKTKTLETARLGGAIDAYAQAPNAQNDAAVQKALAELDGEIAELKELVAKRSGESQAEAEAKLRNLQQYRTTETVRFAALQAKAGVTPSVPPVDARSGGEKVEDTARKVGNTIEDAAKKVGDTVKDAVR